MSPEATMGDTVADQLRTLGTRGVLVQMAQRGQIIELRCEMPMCYCHKGRGYFDPRSTPLTDWAPTPDHYPRLKADGGHLVPWNVRLSHKLCNQRDYLWRMSIRRMLEKGMSLEEIAENLTDKGVRRPHGSSNVVGQSGAKGIRLLGRTCMLGGCARSHSAVGESTPAVRAGLAIAPAGAMTQGTDGADDPRTPADGSSTAEKRVFERLRDDTSDDFVAFHHVAWIIPGERRPEQGEADFVLAHPERGLLVLEVKGGTISYDAAKGRWSTRGKAGDARIKDPFNQARQNSHSLKRLLERGKRVADNRFFANYAVALPDTRMKTASLKPDAPRQIVIDGDDLRRSRSASWACSPTGREGRASSAEAAGVEQIERALAKSFEVPRAARRSSSPKRSGSSFD